MMNTQVVASKAWQQTVFDLNAGKVGMFPQAFLQEEQHLEPEQTNFDELLRNSELLAKAMGRVVRVNPDRTLDVVVPPVTLHTALNAYKSYLV